MQEIYGFVIDENKYVIFYEKLHTGKLKFTKVVIKSMSQPSQKKKKKNKKGENDEQKKRTNEFKGMKCFVCDCIEEVERETVVCLRMMTMVLMLFDREFLLLFNHIHSIKIYNFPFALESKDDVERERE